MCMCTCENVCKQVLCESVSRWCHTKLWPSLVYSFIFSVALKFMQMLKFMRSMCVSAGHCSCSSCRSCVVNGRHNIFFTQAVRPRVAHILNCMHIKLIIQMFGRFGVWIARDFRFFGRWPGCFLFLLYSTFFSTLFLQRFFRMCSHFFSWIFFSCVRWSDTRAHFLRCYFFAVWPTRVVFFFFLRLNANQLIYASAKAFFRKIIIVFSVFS